MLSTKLSRSIAICQDLQPRLATQEFRAGSGHRTAPQCTHTHTHVDNTDPWRPSTPTPMSTTRTHGRRPHEVRHNHASLLGMAQCLYTGNPSGTRKRLIHSSRRHSSATGAGPCPLCVGSCHSARNESHPTSDLKLSKCIASSVPEIVWLYRDVQS